MSGGSILMHFGRVISSLTGDWDHVRHAISPSWCGLSARRGASLSVTIFCPLGTVFRRPAGLGRLPGVGQRGPVRGCASQSDAKNRVAGLGRLPGVG